MEPREPIAGFYAPLHRALTEPLLLGGAPRAVVIVNGTLTDRVTEKVRRSAMWPTTTAGARVALDRIKDALETKGFAFERGREGPKHDRRFLQFTRFPDGAAD